LETKVYWYKCLGSDRVVTESRKKLTNKALGEIASNKYKKWKKKSLEDGGYFVIFNTFKDDYYLRDISGGAVKLFLFFGLSGKNDTGESYYTVEELAAYFKKSKRTIESWIKELENRFLIKRMQKGLNSVAYTYLLPY